MNIQLKVSSPNNCSHMHFEITTPKGVRKFVFEMGNLMQDPDFDLEDTLKGVVRYLVKTNNISTLSELKTMFENKTFKI